MEVLGLDTKRGKVEMEERQLDGGTRSHFIQKNPSNIGWIWK